MMTIAAMAVATQYHIVKIVTDRNAADPFSMQHRPDEVVSIYPGIGAALYSRSGVLPIGLVVANGAFDMVSDEEMAELDQTWTGDITFPADAFDVVTFDDCLYNNKLPNGPGTYPVTIAWRYRFRVTGDDVPLHDEMHFYETVIISVGAPKH